MKTGIRHITIFWLMALFVFPQLCVAGLQDTDSLLPENNKAAYYDSLGAYYSRNADNRKAITFFEKAIILKKAENDSLGMASTYENLSRSYQLLKQYLKAITYQIMASELKSEVFNSYFQQVKRLMSGQHDSLDLTRLYYRYGLFLSKKGKKKQSIDFYVQALKLARALHYNKAIATIANDLAGEYWDLGKKSLSTMQYETALAAAEKINDSNRMAAVYLNLGDNYKEQVKNYISFHTLLFCDSTFIYIFRYQSCVTVRLIE